MSISSLCNGESNIVYILSTTVHYTAIVMPKWCETVRVDNKISCFLRFSLNKLGYLSGALKVWLDSVLQVSK